MPRTLLSMLHAPCEFHLLCWSRPSRYLRWPTSWVVRDWDDSEDVGFAVWRLEPPGANELIRHEWSTQEGKLESVSHLFPCHPIVTLLPTSVIRADLSREATQLDFYVNSLIFSVVQTLKEKQKNNHITCSKQNAPSHWPWALGQPPSAPLLSFHLFQQDVSSRNMHVSCLGSFMQTCFCRKHKMEIKEEKCCLGLVAVCTKIFPW